MKNQIETHYGSDDLLEKIRQGLEKAGKNPDELELKDLAVIDQLHTGGHIASLKLAEKAGLDREMKILDAGCGIGGTSRLLSKEFKCSIIGIDLVQKFIDAAHFLTKSTGMGKNNEFFQMSILETSFEDNSFDCIWCQHTLMNIKDKKSAFSEFKRILKPKGKLVLHEVLKGENKDKQIHLPVPWADSPSLSFLISQEEMNELADDAGFISEFSEDQTEQAKTWWNKVKSVTEKAAGKTRPLGPHIIFGENGKFFGQTMTENLNESLIKIAAAVYLNNGHQADLKALRQPHNKK